MIYRLSFIFILFLLIIFTFLVPPFHKPDEYGHFIRALSVSKGVIFCTKTKNNILKLENQYINLHQAYPISALSLDKKIKLPFALYLKAIMSKPKDFTPQKLNFDKWCGFPFIAYLPHAFGLKISQFFQPNAYFAFFFGRFFMSILAFIWFYYLLKEIRPEFQPVLLFTFALPMTLHQISSYSYDGVHIMLALTFFTYFCNTLPQKKISYRLILPLFLSLILFLLTKKIGYEILLFLIFLVPNRAIAKDRKDYLIKMIIFLLFFLILFIPFKLSVQTEFNSSEYNYLIDPVMQAAFIVRSPLNFALIIAKTTLLKAQVYLQGLIGLFGWLEYGLEPLTYFFYGLFFILIVLKTKLPKPWILPPLKLWMLSLILFSSYVFIQLLTYLFWTPVGEKVTDGVQGRYFIVFVPWIFFLLLQLKKEILIKFTLVIILFYLVFSLCRTVFNRYYLGFY